MHQQMEHMNIQEPTAKLGEHLMPRLREALITKLKPRERETVDRLRQVLRGQPLQEVLARLTPNNYGTITENDIIIGVS
jgi:hypothetical protein